jgi:hypothetical protein
VSAEKTQVNLKVDDNVENVNDLEAQIVKRTKCSKSGGKSKTKGSTMDKAVVTRRKSKEKRVKTRAPGPVDSLCLF